MAAIGKIRSWGPVLVGVIGLALFAFIAEELFRSCDTMKNQERQQIGEVLGKKIDYQQYNKMVDEYQEFLKVAQGRDNLTDEEQSRMRDFVWNRFVQMSVFEKEAEAIGLTVTDKELQNILTAGTNPSLMQTPFVNQQTGRFDVNQLRKFLDDYKKAEVQGGAMAEQYRELYTYWQFIEKSLRQETLVQKYQALLAACLISNPVSAKAAYQAENEESNIQLAAIPYSSISDDKVQVADADLKAKYDEYKNLFFRPMETRDIKYVDVEVEASQTDRAAINKTMQEAATQLAEAQDPTEVVRKNGSVVSYIGIPQTKAAFPVDIASRLDSMAVGSTSTVVENKQDNTLNVLKLVAKQQLPDSVEFRAIQVTGADVAATRKSADSIYNALKAGADFEVVAKKYAQDGKSTWITSAQYQTAPSMDNDTRNYINTLNTAEVNSINNLSLTNANLIVQVLSRRAMTDKYTAAVIKKPIEFSKETYNTAFNKFSQYVSESQSMDAIVNNAKKYGYTVKDLKSVPNTEHYLAGVHSTREAMRWLFDAKAGQVSPLYECGDNNHLMVVVCENINKEGYLPVSNEQVNNFLKAEVQKDKKAEQILNNLKGVTTLEQAKQKGATVTDVNQVTFAAPVFIASTGGSEPALSGAVSATKAGAVSKAPVKGNSGVYLFKVNGKSMRSGVKYDEKAYEEKARQRAMQLAGNFMQELISKAKIKDNRYLFM